MRGPRAHPSRELGAAVERNFVELHRIMAALPEARFHQDERVAYTITKLPLAVFNGVVGGRFGADPERDVGRVVATMNEAAVPWRWITTPQSQPDDLGRHLEAAGLVRHRDHPAMALGLAAWRRSPDPATDLDVRAVDDARFFEHWLGVQLETWELGDEQAASTFRLGYRELGWGSEHPLRNYVGFGPGGAAVAAATLVLGTDTAGVYNVATIPEARGRGFGRAITTAALSDAIEFCLPLAVLASSELGLPLYRRLGFVEAGRVGVFLGPHAGTRGGSFDPDFGRLPRGSRADGR